jgi:hypothetical protein
MGRTAPDVEAGHPMVLQTHRVPQGIVAAVRTRAAAEQVDAAVVYRRLLRIGCQVEGLDTTGLGRGPLPVEITPVATN